MKKRICKICKKVSSLKNFYFMQKWRSWTCKKCVIMAVIKRQNTVGSNAWWNRRYERLKSRAKRSHKKFNLSFIDFRILKQSPCYYCGDKKEIQIDRKDNIKGYLKKNCVSACKFCNFFKGTTISYKKMLNLGKVIYKLKKLDRNEQ